MPMIALRIFVYPSVLNQDFNDFTGRVCFVEIDQCIPPVCIFIITRVITCVNGYTDNANIPSSQQTIVLHSADYYNRAGGL